MTLLHVKRRRLNHSYYSCGVFVRAFLVTLLVGGVLGGCVGSPLATKPGKAEVAKTFPDGTRVEDKGHKPPKSEIPSEDRNERAGGTDNQCVTSKGRGSRDEVAVVRAMGWNGTIGTWGDVAASQITASIYAGRNTLDDGIDGVGIAGASESHSGSVVVSFDTSSVLATSAVGLSRQQKTESITTTSNKENGDMIMDGFFNSTLGFCIILFCVCFTPFGLIAIGWILRDYFNATLRTVASDVKQLADTIYPNSTAKAAKIENNS